MHVHMRFGTGLFPHSKPCGINVSPAYLLSCFFLLFPSHIKRQSETGYDFPRHSDVHLKHWLPILGISWPQKLKKKTTTTLLSLHVCNRKKKSDKVISWISPSRKHAETLERMMYNPEPHWTERPAQPSRSGARGATQHSASFNLLVGLMDVAHMDHTSSVQSHKPACNVDFFFVFLHFFPSKTAETLLQTFISRIISLNKGNYVSSAILRVQKWSPSVTPLNLTCTT